MGKKRKSKKSFPVGLFILVLLVFAALLIFSKYQGIDLLHPENQIQVSEVVEPSSVSEVSNEQLEGTAENPEKSSGLVQLTENLQFQNVD